MNHRLSWCFVAYCGVQSSQLVAKRVFLNKINKPCVYRKDCNYKVYLMFWLPKLLRRRRDSNPRTAINDLLTFQASPFNRLGTSPYKKINKNGEGGIRTHGPFRDHWFSRPAP